MMQSPGDRHRQLGLVAASAEEASAINTMLLVGASQKEGAGFPPGTIYCIQDAEAFARPLVLLSSSWRSQSVKKAYS